MNEKQEEISRIIVDYIRKHPDAKDTLEGITKWWLHLEKIESSVVDVSIALESLIKKGLVKRQKIKGSTPIYTVNKNN